jgi:RHS repeat-associated protein
MQKKTTSGGELDFTSYDLNQYTAVGSVTPTWNSDGGLASFSGNTYTYDALGRLTQVVNASGQTLFSYDPFGRRVKKVDLNASGGVVATYQYHYDGAAVAVEYRPSTTWTYYGGVLRTDGTNNQYYYRDGQGSVSAVTDNSGNVLEAYEYTAQGWFQITNGSGTVLSATGIGNDFMYTGQLYDAETGNYFCNARYYNPRLGRFISRDPLSGAEFSQGTNLYAYCGNDGVNGVDPSGMDGYYWVQSPNGNANAGSFVFFKYPPAAVSTTGPQATKNAMINAANAWNKTAARWTSANDCGAQAGNLWGNLINNHLAMTQYWSISMIGGTKLPIYLPFIGNFPHNILSANPINGNPLPAFTLDPYAGNNSSNNSRNVGVGTPSSFYGQYPYNGY